MKYQLEQGATEKTIIQQCIRQHLPLPDRIANAPSLFVGLELFYKCFLDLTSSRASGSGEGAIGWGIIKDWADEYGVCGESREDLFYHIPQMDEVYLAHKAKQMMSRT